MPAPRIPRYELFEPPLGEGSYGVVYRARFNGLDERAVKVFKRGLLDFDVLRRELEKLAKAKHGGIVVLYDFDLTGETPYYAMGLHAQKDERGKWVGRTLEGICGKVEVKEALRLLRQVAEAGAFLHKGLAEPIIHCDLKPSNVLLTGEESPRVQLCDFGQSRSSAVKTLELSGTPFYASPEQLRRPGDSGEGKGFRWDVYSFGVLAYKVLTGKLPRLEERAKELREEDTARSIIQEGRHALDAEELARLTESEAVAPWPKELKLGAEEKAVVLKCLEIDPERRFAHLGEVAEEFKKIEEGRRAQLRRNVMLALGGLALAAACAAVWAVAGERRARVSETEASHLLGSVYLQLAEHGSRAFPSNLLLAARGLGREPDATGAEAQAGRTPWPPLLKRFSEERSRAEAMLRGAELFPLWATRSLVDPTPAVLSGVSGILASQYFVWSMKSHQAMLLPDRRGGWLDLSPSGRLGVRNGLKQMDVVDVKSGQSLATLDGSSAYDAGAETLVRFCANSQILAVKPQHAGWGNCGPLKVWNLAAPLQAMSLSVPEEEGVPEVEKMFLQSIALSADGDSVAALRDDGNLLVWSGIRDGRPRFRGMSEVVGESVDFLPGRPEVSVSSSGSGAIRLFAVEDSGLRSLGEAKARGQLLHPGGESQPAIVHEKGRGIVVWSSDLTQELKVLSDDSVVGTFGSVAAARDGTAVVLQDPVQGNPTSLKIIGCGNGEVVLDLKRAEDWLVDTRGLSPCGRYLFGSTADHAAILDTMTGATVANLPQHASGVVWSEDGEAVFLVLGDQISRHRTSGDWPEDTRVPRKATGELMAFSGARQALAFGGDGHLEIQLLATEDVVKLNHEPIGRVARQGFDLSGRYLASLEKGDGKGMVTVMDLDAEGKAICSVMGEDFVFIGDLEAVAVIDGSELAVYALPSGRQLDSRKITQDPREDQSEALLEMGGSGEAHALVKYGQGVAVVSGNLLSTYQFGEISEPIKMWELDRFLLAPSFTRVFEQRGGLADGLEARSLALEHRLPPTEDLSARFLLIGARISAKDEDLSVPEGWDPYRVSKLEPLSPDFRYRLQKGRFFGGEFLEIAPVLGGLPTPLEWGYGFDPASVVWSPDGQRVAAMDHGGRVSFWDAHSGRRLSFLLEAPGKLVGLQDGAKVAAFLSDTREELNLVRITDGARLESASIGQPVERWSVEVGKNGRSLACITERAELQVFLWDAERLKRVVRTQTALPLDEIQGVRVSDAGESVLVLAGSPYWISKILQWSKDDGVRTFEVPSSSHVVETTPGALAGREVPAEVMKAAFQQLDLRRPPAMKDISRAVSLLQPWAERFDWNELLGGAGSSDEFSSPMVPPLDGFPPIYACIDEQTLTTESERLVALNLEAALAAWAWMGPSQRLATGDAICSRLLRRLSASPSVPEYFLDWGAKTALRLANDVLEIEPTNRKALLNAGHASALLNDSELAMRRFAAVLNEPQASSIDLLTALFLVYGTKDADGSMRRLLDGPGRRFADAPDVTAFLGWAFMASDLPSALAALRSAEVAWVERKQQAPRGVLVGLALALQLSGDADGAVEAFTKYMDVGQLWGSRYEYEGLKSAFPTNWFPVIEGLDDVRVVAFRKRNQAEDAQPRLAALTRALLRSTKADQDETMIPLLREALDVASEWVMRDPDNFEALREREKVGWLALSAGVLKPREWKPMAEAVFTSREAGFDDLKAIVRRVSQQASLQPDAEVIVGMFIERFPDNLDGTRTAGWAWINLGSPVKAMAAFQDLINQRPADVDGLVGLAIGSWLAGERDASVEALGQVLVDAEHRPKYGSPEAIRSLGWPEAETAPLLEVLDETLKRHPEFVHDSGSPGQ